MIYTGPGNCEPDPVGKGIAIRSTNPENPNIVAHTIIDPNKTGRGGVERLTKAVKYSC
ncbi:MAG: hypothetical protein ACYSSN_02030 [Planctomycetota bacterium]